MILSFIIPVYNTEKYIGECLDSLLAQNISKQEYEIICVNDGSTDGSLAILRNYEAQHQNVRVVDQPNGGVCVARNNGLDAAKGEYIWFIDADDLLLSNCLGDIYSSIITKKYDRIIVGNKIFETVDDLKTDKYPTNSSWKDSVVWRSIFRKSFLVNNELRFYPGLVFGEDALFVFECFRKSPVVLELDLPIYFHRIVMGSASTNVSAEFQDKRLRSTLREAHILQGYYEKNDGIYPQETANRMMVFLLGGLGTLAKMSKKQMKPYMDDLKAWGLYPYKTPPEYTVTKSHQLTRTDFMSKVYDYLYVHMHRPWGFHAMRILEKLIKIRKVKK